MLSVRPVRQHRPKAADRSAAHSVGRSIARVHAALVRWLQREQGLAARVGGQRFLTAQVIAPAAEVEGFAFDYYNDQVRLGVDFLAGWSRFLAVLGERRWQEVVRLFLLHEGHHIGQGMGYNSRDVGRAGVALEAIDYDADVASIETCLAWRRYREPRQVGRRGEMGALADIQKNLLCGLTLFDGLLPGAPLCRLKEHRLRRYLIWHFQHARARAAPPDLPAGRLRLSERVALEIPGLISEKKRRGRHEASYVLLDQMDRVRDLELVIYAGGRVYRQKDPNFCHDLLGALGTSREAERVSGVFNRLFEEHPALVPA